MEEQIKEETKDYEYNHDSLESIEKARAEFFAKYQKANKIKSFVSLFFLVGLVAIWIGLANIPNGTGLMLVSSIVLLAIMFVYSNYEKKRVSKMMSEYFEVYYRESNKYALEEPTYKEFKCDTFAKLDKNQFTDNGLFKDVFQVGSRGLVTVEYKKKTLNVCDCAAQIQGKKRLTPVFVGKYVMCPIDYEESEPIYIYVKGDERTLPPTNLEEVKLVSSEDNIFVYSNNKKWNEFLGEDSLKKLKQIKLDEDLIDISLTIRNKEIDVCLGFDDSLMVIPLQNKLNARPLKSFKKSLASTMKFVDSLSKN